MSIASNSNALNISQSNQVNVLQQCVSIDSHEQQFNQEIRKILAAHLLPEPTNIIIQYEVSSLEDLIKEGSLSRVQLLLSFGKFQKIQMPAVYSCMVSARFGQSNILDWLLASGKVKQEMAGKNPRLMITLFKAIESFALETGHRDILLGLSKLVSKDLKFGSEMAALINTSQRPLSRKDLIINNRFLDLTNYLKQILVSDQGYDRVYGDCVYVKLSGWEAFVLKRAGFIDIIKLLMKGDFTEYHFHKDDLAIVIQFLATSKGPKWMPIHKDDMTPYLQGYSLFPIIEKDLALLNAREALRGCLGEEDEDFSFARAALQEHDISNEELFFAFLKDHIHCQLDAPITQFGVFQKTLPTDI